MSHAILQRDSAFEARVAMLEKLDLLNLDPEPCFDRLVRIAAMSAATPIALITLLGADRQWIKAKVGCELQCTSLSDAFCMHALGDGGLLEVPNATEDPRFSNNSLVLGEQHIRFYAGHPILFHGLILGTVCVLDRVPRHLDEPMKQILSDLSGVVTDVLEKKYQQQMVDEEKQRTTDERIRREAAEKTTQNKTQFLSRVSHELRTPLNAIIGFGQLLLIDPSSPLNDVQKERVEILHLASKHLLALVDDILAISRIEQGALTVEVGPLSLRATVEQALNLVAEDARQHGLTITSDIDAELEVLADGRALQQVLLNLLSNAVKYNRPHGQIWVGATEGESVVLTVRDSGLGLTPEQLGCLFEPFNRLGAEGTSIAGCGLGLVISKGVVEAMGGQLMFESEPGVGTTVSVHLRNARQPSTVSEGIGSPSGPMVPEPRS